MKISHKSKRVTPPHPDISSFIAKLLATPTNGLAAVLSQQQTWGWPRSDLNSWIKVLDSFDTVLADVISEYNVDNMQLRAFEPATKGLVMQILRFERLMLENSTNRKMFNSYDRLNSLLFTSDLDVLVAALFLLLRPSQQYSSQPALSHSLHISTARLESLAKLWPSTREHGISMSQIIDEQNLEKNASLFREASDVKFMFYRRGEQKSDSTESESNPLQAEPSTSSLTHSQSLLEKDDGPVIIHLESLATTPLAPAAIVAETVKKYSVPDEEKFELFCRVRAARALEQGNLADRQRLTVVRLLSIAVFAHTHTESQAQTSLFLYEPEMVTSIAELLQIDAGVPRLVQAAALAALDALARYRNKIHEVLSSVNAGVNHGILMSLLRHTVVDIASSESTTPQYFVEALLAFVTFISSHAAGGNMVVSAGLVPLLIQILDNRLPERLSVVSKTMQLIDNVLYGFTNAFQIFCNGRGVDVLVDRIKFEVDLAVEMHGKDSNCISPYLSYGLLAVSRTGVIKHALRSMHRMMQSSGTTEGLRGLIDSSLLSSVKSIIEHRGLFGPTVLPLAINIMATFVHNEPTSLTVIQEAGLPEAFYQLIETGLESSMEATLPNAIGALSLNQAGQDQLSNRPSIIPSLFSIFTSERHLKVLQEKEHAVVMGSSIDELIRHHPVLKNVVFDALNSTMQKIEQMGYAFIPPSDIRPWYLLTTVSPPESSTQDVTMKDVEGSSDDSAKPSGEDTNSLDEPAGKLHDNTIVSFIDVLSRFLEGLFQHTSHCKDFISSEYGLDRLSSMLAIPCLPYDFASSVSFDSLVQVYRTMTEVASTETLGHIAKQVKVSLESTKDFWTNISDDSKLLPLIDLKEDTAAQANDQFRRLVTLYTRITLLSDVYSTVGYSLGRNTASLLPVLTGPGSPDIIPDLGGLHRACIWENIVFKSGLESSDLCLSSSSAPATEEDTNRPLTLNAGNLETVDSDLIDDGGISSPVNEGPSSSDGPREQNAKALKHIAGQIPGSLAPFFQAIARVFMFSRRNTEASQRSQATLTASAIADVMLKHLQLPSRDLNNAKPDTVYAYYTVMLGLVTLLLFDERTTQNSLHAVLLVCFRNVGSGGVNAILDICEHYASGITRMAGSEPTQRSQAEKVELIHAYSGLRVALHLIYYLVSYKPSSDGGQISLILSPNKPETDPEYYEPHDFLVKMRLTLLPFISKLWTASWLTSAPPGVNKYVVQSILEIIAGENEESRTDQSAEAPSSNVVRRQIGPDEDRIRQLTDMGFSRSSVISALTRAHNNISVATELLLSHPLSFALLNEGEENGSQDAEGNEAGDAEGNEAGDAGGNEAGDAEGNEAGDAEGNEAGDAEGNEAQDAEGDEAQDAEGNEDRNTTDDVPGEASTATATTAPDPDATLSPEEVTSSSHTEQSASRDEGTAEDRRKQLNEAKESLKTNIGSAMLSLLDAHPALIFDVRPAFTGPPDGYQASTVRHVIDDIRKFSPTAYDVHEEPLALRCRLLAMIIMESPTLAMSVLGENEQALMGHLLALLLSIPKNPEKDQITIPKWLASHFLVCESLLVLADEPRGIALPLPEESAGQAHLLRGPEYVEARNILFDFCLRLLSIRSLPRDEYLATLRILVQLTRDHTVAQQFIKCGGLPVLLQPFSQGGDSSVSGSQSYLAIILRHLVEDRPIIERVISQDIKRMFSNPRTKVTDAINFVRNCASLASRDPYAFMDVTKSICKLLRPDTPENHISLKSANSDSPEISSLKPPDSSESEQPPSQTQPNSPSVDSSSESAEMVVHFLISELMQVGRLANDGISSTKLSKADLPISLVEGEATNTTQPSQGADTTQHSERKETDKEQSSFLYTCVLMQYLTELLFSYDSCKTAFLSYSKRREHTMPKDSAMRHKSVALNFLLSELLSFGAFVNQPKADAKKKVMLCNWAMSVIVALCVECSPSSERKEASAELTNIRKVVLETVSRAFKEALTVESVDGRYSRLLALADLCHRLLTVRFNSGSANRSQEDTPIQIAKIMLEKNYVATLTHILSDVDLNYPNMRNLVSAILRPLEHLTKIAIKMGKASERTKEAPEAQSVSSDSESLASEEDVEDAGQDEEHEAPDLYRNSSLGMLRGEMEEMTYGNDSMDQDVEDDLEELEGEYDDDTGSEDTSLTDDEGDEAEVVEMDVGDDGDEWQDEDQEMEDAEEGTEDEEESEDQEDLDVEGLADADLMWQEATGQDAEANNAAEEIEDEDEGADGIPIMNEDIEEDVEPASDDEAEELGLLEYADRDAAEASDPFMFGRYTYRGPSFPERALFGAGNTTRREGDHDLQVFGRRQASPGVTDAMSHPLLIDASATSIPTGQQRGSGRRSQRGTYSNNTYGELLQSIEEIVGGGAVQLFQQLMSHSHPGADIRLEVPARFIAGSDRPRPGRGGHIASVRLERDMRTNETRSEVQDLTPLPTLQRWNEEAKITHGKFLLERLSKLSNHVVLALIPEARERAQIEKEKQEKEKEALKQAESSTKHIDDIGDMTDTPENLDTSHAAENPEQVPTDQPVVTMDSEEQETEAEPIHASDIPETIPEDAVMEDVNELESTPVNSSYAPEVGMLLQDDSHEGEASGAVESDATAPEPAEATSNEATASVQPERITVMVHGSAVDITDTGIDPTFLEALPDDMREEVLNQHFRERRSSRVVQPAESQISPEFLDALPPEIRAEILHEEQLEISRRMRNQSEQEVADPAQNSSGPVDIDPASFIASLEPHLRQVVLLDQDDGFLQTLPAHMIAEAGAYRDTSHRRHHIHRPQSSTPASAPRKTPVTRDAIQLLDRPGIATLVRVLFFPQLTRKGSLHKVLLNLCENSKSRTDLFNLLLSVLQDGAGDLVSVDRSFAQMSFRNSKTPTSSPVKASGKQKGIDFAASSSTSFLPNDISPELVAQRCLDALTYIVEANESSSYFFLTEHELPAGMRKSISKKGKGKEKQTPQSHYPLVLLLGLLDRAIILKTPSIMDSVAGLLDSVTRPLSNLKDTKKGEADSTNQATLPSQADGSIDPVGGTSVSTPAPPNSTDTRPKTDIPVETLEETILLSNPPQIPHPALRLIVNILTIGECSGRTFQHTIALIQHLSCIADARDVIAQELKAKGQDLGQSLQADLDEFAKALQDGSSQDKLPNSLAAKFSPATSDQAKFLRVLKTIDYMFSSRPSSTAGPSQEHADEQAVRGIYESFRFGSLWKKLSECLTLVEQTSDVEHIATILLPLIESLMVVCKHVDSKSSSASRAIRSPVQETYPQETMEDLFVSFTDTHRKVLNLMVRNNPSLISGSFSLLINNPRVLDFDNKRNYFNQQLRKRPASRELYNTLQLNLRRARVFEDSYQHLQRKTGDQIKYGKLSVRFYDEEGVDAGGVTREWFQILARQMFNPDYALFEPCAADKNTYQPNRASAVNGEHLSFFKFVGRVIGKAIFDGRLLDAHFARSLYRQLLGKPVDYRDVEWVDPEYYSSLCWILANDPTMLDLTFISEVDEFGRHDTIPLKENGVSIPVTNENKKEYVQLSAQYRLYVSIKEQIESLLGGFYEIIPKDLISIFNEQEVELLISGTPDIDVDEWRAATDYNGYHSSESVIVWFWRALKSFNRDERAKVLSFTTGTSRVPLGGFTELQGVQGVQKFSIHKAYGDPDRLPQAHTCFNQIDLPQYTSYETLRKQLLLAINEGGEGFGFA